MDEPAVRLPKTHSLIHLAIIFVLASFSWTPCNRTNGRVFVRRMKSKRFDYAEHDCFEDLNVGPVNTLDRHLQYRLASLRDVGR